MTASARAIGTDAADVLPYLSRLTNIFSIGRSRPLATASTIRMLAWWGMNRSMSDGSRPDFRIDSRAVVAIVFVAKR